MGVWTKPGREKISLKIFGFLSPPYPLSPLSRNPLFFLSTGVLPPPAASPTGEGAKVKLGTPAPYPEPPAPTNDVRNAWFSRAKPRES